MKEVVIKGKKGDIFMGKMSFVKNLRKTSKVSYHYAMGA